MNLLNCLITHRTSSDYAPACCVVLSTRNGFAACAGVLVLHYCAFVDFMSEPLPYTHLHAYIWVIYVMGVLASLVVKLISLLQCVSWLKPSLTVVFWLMHTVVENKGTSFQWPWKAGSGVDPAWFSSVSSEHFCIFGFHGTICTPSPEKKVPLIFFCCNFYKCWRIFIIFRAQLRERMLKSLA